LLISNNKNKYKLHLINNESSDYANHSTKQNENIITIEHSDLPIIEQNLFSINKWKNENNFNLRSKEVSELKQIINNEVKIIFDDNEKVKILKIVNFLKAHLDQNQGVPNSRMIPNEPFKQFKHVLNKQSKVWCSNYAQIFNLFAHFSNITSRQVQVYNDDDVTNISPSSHVYNEVYLKEVEKWVVVDVLSNNILPNCENTYLNSIDLNYFFKNNFNNSIKSCFLNDSSYIINKNQSEIQKNYKKYFLHSSKFKYFFPNHNEFENEILNKLFNYTFPHYDGLYLSLKNESNFSFLIFVKFVCLYLMLVVMLLFLASKLARLFSF
jgi:hypothetical protein